MKVMWIHLTVNLCHHTRLPSHDNPESGRRQKTAPRASQSGFSRQSKLDLGDVGGDEQKHADSSQQIRVRGTFATPTFAFATNARNRQEDRETLVFREPSIGETRTEETKLNE